MCFITMISYACGHHKMVQLYCSHETPNERCPRITNEEGFSHVTHYTFRGRCADCLRCRRNKADEATRKDYGRALDELMELVQEQGEVPDLAERLSAVEREQTTRLSTSCAVEARRLGLENEALGWCIDDAFIQLCNAYHILDDSDAYFEAHQQSPPPDSVDFAAIPENTLPDSLSARDNQGIRRAVLGRFPDLADSDDESDHEES